MILIADSGSTKTDWCIECSSGLKRLRTSGINPAVQSADVIKRSLQELKSAIPDSEKVTHVYFYGAGCTKDSRHVVIDSLRKCGLGSADIHVESDMLGAARAVCGNSPGIVGILGTGSNSCVYDGSAIVDSTPSLGYILGDEGSGAYIGKRLIGDCLKGVMSKRITGMFEEETKLTVAQVVEKVYRAPLPNRFLASVSRFCYNHIEEPEVEQFVTECFVDFFSRNVARYGMNDMKVNLVGSISWFYRPQVVKAACRCGMDIGNILQSPIEGLVKYHLENSHGLL